MSADDFAGSYIHYGVREHAMAAAMNGMALHGGFIPYGGTFLIFTDYCRPAIRSVGADGAAGDLRDDPRFDRSRRGRPDASAGRAPGDLHIARKALKRLDWLGHDEAGDYRRLAMLAGALGEQSEALHAYARSLEKHPSAITYASMGELLHRIGNPDAAESAFYDALEINPNHLGSIRSIGLIRLQRGDIESAIEMFEHGLSISPDDPQMKRSMDMARRRQKLRGPAPEGAGAAAGREENG